MRQIEYAQRLQILQPPPMQSWFASAATKNAEVSTMKRMAAAIANASIRFCFVIVLTVLSVPPRYNAVSDLSAIIIAGLSFVNMKTILISEQFKKRV